MRAFSQANLLYFLSDIEKGTQPPLPWLSLRNCVKPWFGLAPVEIINGPLSLTIGANALQQQVDFRLQNLFYIDKCGGSGSINKHG